MTEARTFPVLWQGSREYLARLAELGCPREVPWDLIASHRNACLRNHSQTPERLAERGGLSPAEMVAVVGELTGRELYASRSFTAEQETDLLKAIVKVYASGCRGAGPTRPAAR